MMMQGSSQGEPVEKISHQYKTAVTIHKEALRWEDETSIENIEVLMDGRFGQVFTDANKNAGFLKNYQVVQTCVKSRRGLGEPIIVTFRAPFDPENPEKEIRYDYAGLGEDVHLIQTNEFKYCLKQCYKMAFYISKIHKVELLSMTAEFLKDENHSIWFSHATKIFYRPIFGLEEEGSKVQKISYINK